MEVEQTARVNSLPEYFLRARANGLSLRVLCRVPLLRMNQQNGYTDAINRDAHPGVERSPALRSLLDLVF